MHIYSGRLSVVLNWVCECICSGCSVLVEMRKPSTARGIMQRAKLDHLSAQHCDSTEVTVRFHYICLLVSFLYVSFFPFFS